MEYCLCTVENQALWVNSLVMKVAVKKCGSWGKVAGERDQ